jgi:hypothetical protein
MIFMSFLAFKVSMYIINEKSNIQLNISLGSRRGELSAMGAKDAFS